MDEAARRAGAPAGAINWMTTVTLEGTQELMKQRDVAVILATGGMGLVRAAYSAGKPAYGVGPGNAPAFIERTANVKKAVRDIVTGKTFDNGVLCSSENSVVVDEPIAEEVKREFQAQGALLPERRPRSTRSRKVLVTPQRLPNPALVGKSAAYIAEQVRHHRAARDAGPHRAARRRRPRLSRCRSRSSARCCPFYVVKDWREGCERCKQILRYGGMGHTMSIHSQNDQVILEFGLKKPAFRIVVNSPTTHGSIGLTTGLDPAMTLGCGGYGGNITSDNISPRHLLNIKRLAYEIDADRQPLGPRRAADAGCARRRCRSQARSRPPVGAAKAPAPAGISADALSRRIDDFLGSRGFKPEPQGLTGSPGRPYVEICQGNEGQGQTRADSGQTPFGIVCEGGRPARDPGRAELLVPKRAIVTPAAAIWVTPSGRIQHRPVARMTRSASPRNRE